MRLQLFFQSRTENARLDPRAARHGVDFENLVEVAQVDYDDPGKGVALGTPEAAGDARSAAIRDACITIFPAPVEDGSDVFFVARIGHDVRSLLEIAPVDKGHVLETLTVRMNNSVPFFRGTEILQRSRDLYARRIKFNLVQSRV